MSGRPYTMLEMRGIVDYLTKHNAYKEIRGRKMWTDFANSQLTTRTWQSLKETFLKRILPDIHNPYYGLSQDQIYSFRRGVDLPSKAKLEVVTVDSEDSDPIGENKNNNEASTSKAIDEELIAGEVNIHSKSIARDRASVETVILDNCYDTAEDIRKVLDSSSAHSKEDDEFPKSSNKSLRDLITYSEPLTPMLQEVLHDFDSGEESESMLQIVEKSPSKTSNQEKSPNKSSEKPPVKVEESPKMKSEIERKTPWRMTSQAKTSNQEKSPNKSSEKPPVKVKKSSKMKSDTEKKTPWRMTDVNIKSDNSTQSKTKKKSETENKTVRKTTDAYTISDSTDSTSSKTLNKTSNSNKPTDAPEENPPPKIKSLRLRKKHANSDKYVVASELDVEKPNADMANTKGSTNIISQNDKAVVISEEKETEITKTPQESTQNFINGTNDSELPNNQEAFGNGGKDQIESQTQNTSLISMDPNKITRKRSSLQEMSCDSKRQSTLYNNVLKSISMSDTNISLMKSDTEMKSKANSNEESQKVDNVMKSPETKTTNNISDNKSSKDCNDLDIKTPPSLLNPCLQSVSLYEEQFNTKSYVSSSDEDNIMVSSKTTEDKLEKGKKSTDAKKEKDSVTDKVKDKSVKPVVILNSHSESDSNSDFSPEGENPEKKVDLNNKDSKKTQRSKALADVFGFSSGGVTIKRTPAKHTKCNVNNNKSSTPTDCSDWTSESDSDYISPPRGRRNRRGRKYLKPKSLRIHSLEDEGGLFVMLGKRIYPLIKDGKTMKNFLTYNPETDPDEEDNYWKQKYIDERLRVEELKKLVNQNRESNVKEKSPILHLKSPRKSTSGERDLPPISKEGTTDIPKEASVTRDNLPSVNKTVKIKFAQKDQEVELEGHWSQLHPVLEDVVHIFRKDAQATPTSFSSKLTDAPKTIDLISDASAADDASDVHEKVNKLETEIFKEIEKRAVEDKDEILEEKNEVTGEKEEDIIEAKEAEVKAESNVTKRKRQLNRGQTPTSSSRVSAAVSPSLSNKRLKISKSNDEPPATDVEAIETKPVEVLKKVSTPPKAQSLKAVSPNAEKLSPKKAASLNSAKSTPKKAEGTKDQKLTPKKSEKPSPKKGNNPTESIATTKPRRIKSKTQIEDIVNNSDDDTEIRYMFPKNRKPTMKTAAKTTKAKEQKQYTGPIPRIFVSPNLSVNSDSTQGYLDSDISPPKLGVRRKRRLSLASVGYRNKRARVKRKSYPIIDADVSSDSHQSFKIILKSKDDLTLKSEVYRSDSYQLLLPRRMSSFKPLEKIDEVNPLRKDDIHSLPPNSPPTELHIHLSKITDDASTSSQENPDGINSSNVSLPLSPELSIVEKISISRELINNSTASQPTLNEIQAIDATDEVKRNKFLLSEVDVSMPLMQQECGFHSKSNNSLSPMEKHGTTEGSVTESLLNKINTVNIDQAQTLSESLNIRLTNLLLESAKKISGKYESDTVDSTDSKKTRANKRCSTPRKKKEIKKKVQPTVDPVIEEEYMESCSYGGRKSCPPSIHIVNNNDLPNIVKNRDEQKNSEKPVTKKKSLGRKKKDVIKVKILRPKDKSPSKIDKQKDKPSKLSVSNKAAKRKSIPVAADSGINDTESMLSHLNDSVDLIHNHSETCLQAHECIQSDSVEFIETNANSVISLNSNSTSSVEVNLQPTTILSPKIFSADAEKVQYKVIGIDNEKSALTSEDEFHSPISNEMSTNSLITEDLSDEISPQLSTTNWYLLSEDDTNTNLCPLPKTGIAGFTSNLKQLFPVTCAVPDLSTITEISKDIETSKKRTLEFSNCDSNTMDDLDSQNIFDNNY